MFLNKERPSKSANNKNRVIVNQPGPGEYNPKNVVMNSNTY